MGDAFGWLLMGGSLLLPLLFRELRASGAVLAVYYVVVLLHHSIAITNSFYVTTLGAEADATDFFNEAVRALRGGQLRFPQRVGTDVYVYLLGSAFRLTSVSLFLGCQMTVAAFAVSCGVLLRLLRRIGQTRYHAWTLLLFGAAPPMLLYGSVTMREPYQVLFFMLAIYYALVYHLTRRLWAVAASIVAALTMGLFHNGLLPFAAVLLTILFLWPVHRAVRLPTPTERVASVLGRVALGVGGVALAAGFLVFASSSSTVPQSGALAALTEGEALTYASGYGSGRRVTRASYERKLDASSPQAFARTAVPGLVYYVASPFPWQVNTPLDAYGAAEALLRVLLIGASVRALLRSRGPRRRVVGLLLTLYVAMTVLWALGTGNYGTAIRHNLVNSWIVIGLGLPLVLDGVMQWVRRDPVRRPVRIASRPVAGVREA